MPTFRGFILHPTYRVEAGTPVLHLHGRLEDGRAFLVRDRRLLPRFYVEAKDAERARAKTGKSMFQWLDEVVRAAAENDLGSPPRKRR